MPAPRRPPTAWTRASPPRGSSPSCAAAGGSRAAARGFLPAPAYVGGETVQETGGGVCQGSSTVYLAALRANL